MSLGGIDEDAVGIRHVKDAEHSIDVLGLDAEMIEPHLMPFAAGIDVGPI